MEEPNNMVAERIVRDLIGSPSNSNVTFSVNAGGAGLWIAATCCVVMLSVMAVAGLWLSREFQRIDTVMADHEEKIDRAQTYLSAIYAQAPQLRPSEENNNAE